MVWDYCQIRDDRTFHFNRSIQRSSCLSLITHYLSSIKGQGFHYVMDLCGYQVQLNNPLSICYYHCTLSIKPNTFFLNLYK